MDQPYRPSSGTEGVMFESSFCDRCCLQPTDPKDGGCNIFMRMFCNDLDDPQYPIEIIRRNGVPMCTAFISRKRYRVLKRMDEKTTYRLVSSDRWFANDDEAIDHYTNLYPNKAIEIWENSRFVWISNEGMAALNKQQFKLF